MTTALHVMQHGIDLENVHAPAAAQEYARRLAQRGVPVAALLRAYRIGATRFQDWCLEELGRRTDNASVISAAGLRIADVLATYIDRVSQELVSALYPSHATRVPSGDASGLPSRTSLSVSWRRPVPSGRIV